jgi:N-acetyltransferase 10
MLEKDLNLPSNQLLALLNKIVKKVISLFEDVNVREFSKSLNDIDLKAQSDKIKEMVPLKQSLAQELNEEAEKVLRKEKEEKKTNILQLNDLKQYAIKGDNNDWSDALKIGTGSSYVTVKRHLFSFSINSINYLINYLKNDNRKT